MRDEDTHSRTVIADGILGGQVFSGKDESAAAVDKSTARCLEAAKLGRCLPDDLGKVAVDGIGGIVR